MVAEAGSEGRKGKRTKGGKEEQGLRVIEG